VENAGQFQVGTPGGRHRDVRLRFDCNDFPLYRPGSVAELTLAYHQGLAAAWANFPRTRLRQEKDRLVVRFEGCKIDLPLGRLLPAQKLPASLRLALGEGARGSFRVDLSEVVDGAVAGGMSFTVER